MQLQYLYAAEVLAVVDGDTLSVRIDLGFNASLTDKIRLYGVNTPETHGAKAKTEGAAGAAAARFTSQWCTDRGNRILIKSHSGKKIGQEKYGRWLAEVYGSDDACLNTALIEAGHAVAMLY